MDEQKEEVFRDNKIKNLEMFLFHLKENMKYLKDMIQDAERELEFLRRVAANGKVGGTG